MENLVYKPGLSISEFADLHLVKCAKRLQVFSSFSKYVCKYFSNPKLIALMEFSVLFLDAMPQDTPALYSLMNYAGLKLGTWYPTGGFGKVIEVMVRVCKKQGTAFHLNTAVEKVLVRNGLAHSLLINGQEPHFDAIIASADYHHVENNLLPGSLKDYKETYWEEKTFALSCLIFFIGLTKKIKLIQHHTLFFEMPIPIQKRKL